MSIQRYVFFMYLISIYVTLFFFLFDYTLCAIIYLLSHSALWLPFLHLFICQLILIIYVAFHALILLCNNKH